MMNNGNMNTTGSEIIKFKNNKQLIHNIIYYTDTKCQI